MQNILRQEALCRYGVYSTTHKLLIAFITLVFLVWAQISHAKPVTVVALGDSLTAGYGLNDGEGLVPQLQAWLAENGGAEITVQNAGVSGDTTAGGRARLDWALDPQAGALMVLLGGNDMLRGLPVAEVRANMTAILEGAKTRDLPVLVVGMKAPLNWGPAYKTEFDALFGELAAQYDALYYDDYLGGLTALGANPADPASMAQYMQSDAIHPNAEGVKHLVAALGPSLLALADQAK